MASNDFPFAMDIKFSSPTGTEYMVHVRAPNIEAFAVRLSEMARTVPETGLTPVEAVPSAPILPANGNVGPPPVVTPIVTGDPTQDAQYREAAHRINQKAAASNGNTPKCNVHQRPLLPSRYGGWYCPAKADDGTYCTVKIAA